MLSCFGPDVPAVKQSALCLTSSRHRRTPRCATHDLRLCRRAPPPRSCISTATLLVPTRPPCALLPRRALPRKLMLNQKVIAFFHGNISTYQTTTTIVPYILCKRSQTNTNQITFTIVYVYSSVVYKLLLSRQRPLTSSSKQFCLLQKTNDHTAFVPAACSPYLCRLLPPPPLLL